MSLQFSRLNSGRMNVVLVISLLLSAVLSAVFVSVVPSGYLLVMGILGLALVALTLRYPIVGFYFCFVFSFFLFDIIRFFNIDLPLGALMDVMMYMTFGGVVVNKIAKKEDFWMHCNHPIVLMFLLVLFYFIFQFFNPNGGSTQMYFLVSRRFFALLLFFYSAIQLFSNYRTIKRFFVVLIILAVITGAYAVYQHFFGLMNYELNAMFRDPVLQRQILANIAVGRLRQFSFLSDCTSFGIFMSGTAIIPLTFLMQLNTKFKNKILLLIAFIILAMGMAFSGTRTATAMLIAEVALYLCITINQWKTLVFAGFVVVVVIVIMFVPTYGNQTIARLRTTFDSEDASLNVRNNNRHRMQQYIYANPFGGGVRTTGTTFEGYNVGHPLAGFPTDSGLLSLALEIGWVGLLLQCITYFVFLRKGIHEYFNSRKPEYKAIYLASTLTLFGYVVAQYSQVAIGQMPGSLMFYSFLATIIRLPQIEKNES